ncbi:hypothetical protein [Thalassobellus suaedae]|uniref:Uncharacterized protein n=1 Tax=Thalassobellus suaedae TaxID=3074124 RepID=A0ABY9XXR4_9FLAO|nr:hypothetical protein RHP51_08180 [Flavobacteriaceae bacterium HL-DH14]
MTFSKKDNFVKLDVAKLNPIKTLISFVENDSIKPIVYLDSTSFDTQENFEAHWNMFYPWGTDHNGSARMHKENIILEEKGILKIKAEYTNQVSEGKSSSDPHLPITFHSGAVHFNKQIKVTKDLPCWTISGDFKAPTVTGS